MSTNKSSTKFEYRDEAIPLVNYNPVEKSNDNFVNIRNK